VSGLSAAALAFLTLGSPGDARDLLMEIDATPHARESSVYASLLPQLVRAALDAGDAELAARFPLGVDPVYPSRQEAVDAANAVLADAGDAPPR
jgi:hypothetical protein